MRVYNCVAYNDGDARTNETRFYVRAMNSGEAIRFAKEEAVQKAFAMVYIEDAGGMQIYDGPASEENEEKLNAA